jgi:hypothetical protein
MMDGDYWYKHCMELEQANKELQENYIKALEACREYQTSIGAMGLVVEQQDLDLKRLHEANRQLREAVGLGISIAIANGYNEDAITMSEALSPTTKEDSAWARQIIAEWPEWKQNINPGRPQPQPKEE